jgi:predicted ArsR family transcriptional regulator
MTFKTTFHKEKFLEALSSEPQSSKEIADKVGCSTNTAKTALFALEGEGEVKKKLISGKYWVWWKE